VKSVKELIALAKARPGQLNYASGTVGATPFLAGELFKYMAKVDIVRVAYKGTGPSMIGVMSGESQLMFPGAGSVWSHVEGGRLRALGVASTKPSPLTPGLQPIALTVPGYESTSNIAFFAPAKTPQPIIDRLHSEIVKAIHKPDVKEILLKGGVEPLGSTPKELGDYVEMDINRITKMLKATGFKSK
jgi:tripartite-type tricarboxylate transporter receptor subunit TctC